MYFLGLSALAHDTAAALLDENDFHAAIEESKLSRARSTTGIPREAIRFCLDNAAISWREIRAIAVVSRPWQPWLRRAGFRGRYLPIAPASSAYYQSKLLGELARAQ